MSKFKVNTEEINSKLKKLQVVKKQLKSEFVGIDKQIDQLVESVKLWYIFPETLNKPLIVNLWGITGTFKTSVIRRFVTLLNKDNEFKEIDARRIPSGSVNHIIGTGSNVDDPELILPTVFLLDEFQNVRTISNRGDDTEAANELYELFAWLSDGKIKYTRSVYQFSKLNTLIKNIEKEPNKIITDVNKQIEKRKGYRLRNAPILVKALNMDELHNEENNEESPILFADVFYDLFYSTLEDYSVYAYGNIVQFKDDIDSLFKYILEKFKHIKLDHTLDLSKSLIFVAGNVDEAFEGLTHTMDNEMLTPDQFYEISSKVNFNVIKESLLHRFKPEQVARLGTNHIIFPSFNTKMYTNLINSLNKRSVNKFKHFGIKIEIDKSVTHFMLKHAAIPSQGSRSVLSAHEYLVDSNIPEALAKSLMTKGKKVIIAIDNNNNIIIKTNKELIFKEITIIDTNVLTNYENKDLNYTIALHEAGHSICGIALMGILPDVIKTRLNDGSIGGYCKFDIPEGLMTRSQVVDRIALSMGGYAAETIRKGFNNVSIGSSSDLHNATHLASVMVKTLGLGSTVSASGYSMNRDGLTLYNKDELEKEVENLVEEGLFLAFNVLVAYDKEHKELTKILMQQPTTKAEDIKHLF